MSENGATVIEIRHNNKWHRIGDRLNDYPDSPTLTSIMAGDKEGVLIAQMFYTDGSVTVVPWHAIQEFRAVEAVNA